MSGRVRLNRGASEGYLGIFDPDLAGDWDAKLSHEDLRRGDKAIRVFRS